MTILSRIVFGLSLLLALPAARARGADPDAPFFLPWEAPADAFADARPSLDPPAGTHGRVVVRDGHLAFERGGRARFWGTNLSGEACFPPPELAPRLADRLAKFGFNLVRFHGMDAGWGRWLFDRRSGGTRRLDPEALERLDRIVAELERRGISINLNLHVGRRFAAADGVAEAEWLGYAKYATIFDPRLIELQKEYARSLLAHRNPHTGRTYAEDPAVIIVELTNENSLFGGWTRGYLRGEQRGRPASGWADIPPFYGAELTRFYNAWLLESYGDRAKLAAAWGDGARPAGSPMLASGARAPGLDGWQLSVSAAAAATGRVDGEGAGRTIEVDVTRVTGTRWHVMLTQRPLVLRKGERYAVRFEVRASTPRAIAAEVCHAGPYRGYAYHPFEATPQWSQRRFSFEAPEDDENARLSIQLGEAIGVVRIRAARMETAAIRGLGDDEDPAAGTVRRLAPEAFGEVTDARFRDEGRFLFEIERAYNLEMARFLREDVGLRALIEGTNHNYGLPCLRAESSLDLMDCHAYWQHPSFPRQPWSRTDWTIGNSPMLDDPRRSTIAGLVRSSVLGKPFTVSEYNHPFPSEYGCEMPLLLAAYAALQDWDAVYPYTFCHRVGDAEVAGDTVGNYFDIANEVPKMAQMIAASLLFRRADVQPAERLVTVAYDPERVFDSLRAAGGSRGFEIDGPLSPLLPLVHRFRVERFDADRTTRAAEIGFVEPGERIASDTGEIVWRTAKDAGGSLTIDAPRIAAAIGRIGGKRIRVGPATIAVETPFCAVSLVSLDGEPIARSARILLVAAARCANTGMIWNDDRTSIGDRWGASPIRIEPVEGEMRIARDADAPPLRIAALDGRGVATGAWRPVEPGEPIRLGADPKTVWYAIAGGAVEETGGAVMLHVAPDGNDAWSGRPPAPAPDRTDGPLATLDGARDAIRRLRATPSGSAVPVTVRVREGTYALETPFVLEPQDSGTAEAPVTYEAYPGERPVVSGGRRLTGFVRRGPFWEREIPEVRSGRWIFRQLFVNGGRRPRARIPNEGFLRIAGTLAPPREKSGFIFRPGDLAPWEDLGDANVILMHSWETSIHPLKSIDETSRTVEFSAPLKEWWAIGHWEREQRYFVEGVREGLDRPGEWHLDRASGILRYLPLPGERIEDAEIIAPVLEEILRLDGEPDAGRLVRWVRIRGLRFHHADWPLPPGGASSTQAAVEAPSAVVADGAASCAIERCEIAHTGGYGIWLRRGCKDCRVAGCRLRDLGAGGIRVGETAMPAGDASESSDNLIDDNHIFDGGHVFPAGVGVWVAQSSGNRISHNDIHDLFYTGISIGWNWNDAPNRCHHNTIEANHIHDLVRGLLSDAGGIYTLGVSPGSVIRGNVIHDIWPYETPPFGWGIYLDATCGGYLVEDNIVHRTMSGGLMYNNGGHEHVIRNNIFALSARVALWPFWERRPSQFTHNIVYWTQGDLIVPHAGGSLEERRHAGESLGTWDHNLYFHPEGGDRIRFLGRTFSAWQALGLDAHSLVADPGFRDPRAGDFSLASDSPALALGFRPIDVSGVGLYGDPAWVAEPLAFRHPPADLPPPPPPPPPREVRDGFEETPAGAAPQGATVSGEGRGASIRVSEEQAASGRRSLKVTDAKAVEPAWQPHFFYEPRIRAGRVREGFDVRIEPGALFLTEWRDGSAAYPANIGPSVIVDAARGIVAAGKTLCGVPAGAWFRIEIEASLGPDAARSFALAVRLPGEEPRIFPDLPFAGADFRTLDWLGFSSTAAADSVFYLDDIRVESVR
ncbi:MAG: right-handed parallel beta-helix repeat-containing protein [Planctomycetes bacterium]|nr:right-handed parallel beta-helix repeat-containing protein [Planctomycetota bacterium]